MKIKIEPDSFDWPTEKVKGIFSKELLKVDPGTPNLIKIDPKAIYPDHIHPDKTEYAYTIEETPEFIINNNITRVSREIFLFSRRK